MKSVLWWVIGFMALIGLLCETAYSYDASEVLKADRELDAQAMCGESLINRYTIEDANGQSFYAYTNEDTGRFILLAYGVEDRHLYELAFGYSVGEVVTVEETMNKEDAVAKYPSACDYLSLVVNKNSVNQAP